MTHHDKPRILIVGTGGTISGKMLEDGSISSSQYTAEEFLRVAPELKQIADLHTMEILRLDSVNTSPDNWVQIAETVYTTINGYDGIVITHGVDTMQFTAAALSFMVQNLPIPIVLTGAQLPIHFVASDARQNIVNAVQVATQADIAEVCIVFNGQIFRGVRVRRTKAIETDAFQSLGIDPLGIVRHQITMSGVQVSRSRKKAQLETSYDDKVALLTMYPGIKPDIMETYLEQGYRAIILVGYGVGYVPTEEQLSFLPYIQQATAADVPVVVASQCAFGHYAMEFYEVGKELQEAGAISAGDMLWEVALVKTMWILGQTKDRKEFTKLFSRNIANEIIK